MQIEIDKLIRSRRRTMAIEVNKQGELVIRAPLRVSERDINIFLWHSRDWIERTQAEVQAKLEQATLRRAEDSHDEQWYRERAAEIIPERVLYHANELGLEYTRVRISNAKRLWGSCSGKNSLSFSWRLAMAPIEVVDYIVVHELTHTIHKNHGKLFWRRVAKTVPNYKELRCWLRKNEHLLNC
ncbi:MAG: SprT family zinc-dependent metalloprotease [Candidatus Uhrbacteria bacterium]